jgi:putative adenylate-forming enzyme
LLRFNTDYETFLSPFFFLACKHRFKSMSWSGIQEYQLRKAQNVVRYAVRFSPFFEKHYCGMDLADVWKLPTVNKKIMMSNLGEYNTLGLSREEIINFCLQVERTRDFARRYRGLNIGLSSGTSGNKGVEITTPREESYMRMMFFARFPFPRAKLNLAFILRVSTPAFNINILGNRLTYISQLSTLEEMRGKLQAIDPNVISAPASILRILAREKTQGRLDTSPLQLISYAEVLYPEDRAYLSDVFGCPVYEIYKATEGGIAQSCGFGSLHINEDLIAVQLLDADGSITPPGSAAERMIVTDLHKTSQPILRYELNDVITIDPDGCDCGSSFRVIVSIQGRADDIFWAQSSEGRQWQFISPDYIQRAIIASSEHIEEYQAIQASPDNVLVRLQMESSADQGIVAQEVRDRIERVFQEYRCDAPRVDIAFGVPELNPQSGKLIRIRRDFEAPID